MLVKFEIQDTIQYNNCILNINTLQNRKRYKIQVYREKKLMVSTHIVELVKRPLKNFNTKEKKKKKAIHEHTGICSVNEDHDGLNILKFL